MEKTWLMVREGGRDGKDEAWARRFERRLLVNFNHRIQVVFFFRPDSTLPSRSKVGGPYENLLSNTCSGRLCGPGTVALSSRNTALVQATPRADRPETPGWFTVFVSVAMAHLSLGSARLNSGQHK